MDQSTSLEANSCSAAQEIPCPYITCKFTVMFTRTHQWILPRVS